MKILVTGGAGFIGSNLTRQLLAETDHEIVNLDKLTYAGSLSSLDGAVGNSRYHFEQADLCDAEAVRSVFERHRPEAVMHLAAESHVDRSIDGPGAFVKTNVLGTFNLLEAARIHWSGGSGGHRFLHVSTDEVYGSLGSDDPAFSENTAYDPHSPYSASKAASDHLARAWHRTYGLPVIVTNCSNNYGPYQFPEKLIPVVILKCLRGESIPVYGKGENVRDWLYVGDHCRALRLVLEKGSCGQTYTIGGENELRNIDLVRMLCDIVDDLVPQVFQARASGSTERRSRERNGREECGRPEGLSAQSLIQFVTDRPGHDMRYAIDATRIRGELGWEPFENTASGFRKTVQWYLENRDWWESILDGSYQFERQGLLA